MKPRTTKLFGDAHLGFFKTKLCNVTGAKLPQCSSSGNFISLNVNWTLYIVLLIYLRTKKFRCFFSYTLSIKLCKISDLFLIFYIGDDWYMSYGIVLIQG